MSDPIEIELSDQSMQMLRDVEAHVNRYTARRDALDFATRTTVQVGAAYTNGILDRAYMFHRWLTEETE